MINDNKNITKFVYPKNPHVFELVKQNKKRSLAISNIKAERGFCKWCLCKLNNIRKWYCSEDCKSSVWAFFYPQKCSHAFLLDRQNNKCANCEYEWNNQNYLKDYEKGKAYEVDHIIPIFKGGEILGIENVQLLCQSCHRIKSAEERKKGV